MKFAVIGDIHSNKYALESVLEDIKERNVDFVISTGDLVGYLPYPNEVIDLLRRHSVLSVKGNHDEFISNCTSITKDEFDQYTLEKKQASASAIYTNYVITDENRRYLKGLPSYLKFEMEGINFMVVHGSHRDISEYLYEDEEYLSELSMTLPTDVLICGHTHIPYHYTVNHKTFINVGSVGKPKTGNELATYTIIHVDNQSVQSEVVQVSYDLDTLVKEILDNEAISNTLVDSLRHGK